ncbi:DinB family protein [Olivibacter sp. XZL3]|uniref:DinB family protein n=1 Tax=Olivibacter sp. XZL3 TaxID=1735116 RepID=UPI0010667B43|nr:DinB family protein [Olivibacter sp. XZL3]
MMQEKIGFKSESAAFTTLVRNYVDYNLWTNMKLINWLKTKPEELLEKEVPSSFSSIYLTLDHMRKVQDYWFSVISKKGGFRGEAGLIPLDETMSRLVEQSAQITDYVNALEGSQLQEVILVDSPWFTCEFSASEYIIQCVNHNTYHRGQIVSIGRQLGFIDAPMTDYNFYNIMGQ